MQIGGFFFFFLSLYLSLFRAGSPTDQRDGVRRGRHDLCNQQHEDGEREQDSDACRPDRGEMATLIFMQHHFWRTAEALGWLRFSEERWSGPGAAQSPSLFHQLKGQRTVLEGPVPALSP